jgi:hypothetical protein
MLGKLRTECLDNYILVALAWRLIYRSIKDIIPLFIIYSRYISQRVLFIVLLLYIITKTSDGLSV